MGGCLKTLSDYRTLYHPTQAGEPNHGCQPNFVTTSLTSVPLTPLTATRLANMYGAQMNERQRKHIVTSKINRNQGLWRYLQTNRPSRRIVGDSEVVCMPWLEVMAIFLNKITL